ncbi:hypothetical protein HLBENOHH_02454 [Aeromonas dhakensis]|uniref:hypothetical protein n=1 Tax=Aeromonas dhakensis TaxID=196024 RepID=UPI0036708642
MKYSNYYLNTTAIIKHGKHGKWTDLEITSLKSQDGTTIREFTRMTCAEFDKLLKAAGYPTRSAEGRAIRRAIASIFERDNIKQEKNYWFYFDEKSMTVSMFDIIEVEHSNYIIHYGYLISKNKDKAGFSVYESYSKDFNSLTTERKSMRIKTDFGKVETRGRKANKVVKPIEVESTLVENNVATVEIKEVVNQHADVINEQQDELAALKAQMAAMAARMAELEQNAGANTPVISGRYTNAPAANGRYDRNEYLNQAIEDLVVNL